MSETKPKSAAKQKRDDISEAMRLAGYAVTDMPQTNQHEVWKSYWIAVNLAAGAKRAAEFHHDIQYYRRRLNEGHRYSGVQGWMFNDV